MCENKIEILSILGGQSREEGDKLRTGKGNEEFIIYFAVSLQIQ